MMKRTNLPKKSKVKNTEDGSLNYENIQSALTNVNGCLININNVKHVFKKLNSAHKNHKLWLKFTSLKVRSQLDKESPEYNEYVSRTLKANSDFNKSFQIDEDHIKIFENVIQVSCKVCFDYCSDEVKEIIKKSLESTHNYYEAVEYLIVYLNQVKKYIISEKVKYKKNYK